MPKKTSLWSLLAGLVVSACAAKGHDPGAAAGGSGAGGPADVVGVEPAMKGTLYDPGRVFVQTYCGPCHWKGGQHAKQPVAYVAFQVDTYEEWATSQTIITAVLDKWNPDGTIMPPPEAPKDPPDDERKLILDWVARGSPNSPSGS
jgi:hypothetical protein